MEHLKKGKRSKTPEPKQTRQKVRELSLLFSILYGRGYRGKNPLENFLHTPQIIDGRPLISVF